MTHDRDARGDTGETLILTIRRSARRTLALQVLPDLTVLAKAPYSMPEAEIHAFVRRKRDWIERQRARFMLQAEAREKVRQLRPEELAALMEEARRVIPERVRHYAPLVGVSYGRVTIRHQHSRWGSCSAKGNLNFNCLLMLAPLEVLDSVVVHELCHRKEMNHSPRFYAEVLRVFPDYEIWHGWLKKNGALLMERLPC